MSIVISSLITIALVAGVAWLTVVTDRRDFEWLPSPVMCTNCGEEFRCDPENPLAPSVQLRDHFKVCVS